MKREGNDPAANCWETHKQFVVDSPESEEHSECEEITRDRLISFDVMECVCVCAGVFPSHQWVPTDHSSPTWADNQVPTLLTWREREREVAGDNEARPSPVFAAQANRWSPHSESSTVTCRFTEADQIQLKHKQHIYTESTGVIKHGTSLVCCNHC